MFYRLFRHFSFDLSLSVSTNRLKILKIIGKCYDKHMTSPIKTITLVLKILTYIVTNITASPIGLTVILVIISVSTF